MPALATQNALPPPFYPLTNKVRAQRGREIAFGRKVSGAIGFLEGLGSFEFTIDYLVDEDLHESILESWESSLGQIQFYLTLIQDDGHLLADIHRFSSNQASRYIRAREAAIERLSQHQRFISHFIFEAPENTPPLFPTSEHVPPGEPLDLDL